MLPVILKILSILGWVLLVLIIVVLVLLLLLLFVPLAYRVQARKNPEETFAGAKVGWLFGFVRVLAEYKEEFSLKVKLLAFTIYEPGGDEKEKKEKKGKKESPREPAEVKEESTTEDAVETVSEPVAEVRDEPAKEAKKEKKEQQSFPEKITRILEKVSNGKEILEERKTKVILDRLFFRVGKLLKALKPRRLKGDILFGTGSPDTTGYAFGAYGMLSPYIGQNVYVNPDFEQAILQGEFEMSGRITVFTILTQVIPIMTDRELKNLLNRFRGIDNHKQHKRKTKRKVRA